MGICLQYNPHTIQCVNRCAWNWKRLVDKCFWSTPVIRVTTILYMLLFISGVLACVVTETGVAYDCWVNALYIFSMCLPCLCMHHMHECNICGSLETPKSKAPTHAAYILHKHICHKRRKVYSICRMNEWMGHTRFCRSVWVHTVHKSTESFALWFLLFLYTIVVNFVFDFILMLWSTAQRQTQVRLSAGHIISGQATDTET